MIWRDSSRILAVLLGCILMGFYPADGQCRKPKVDPDLYRCGVQAILHPKGKTKQRKALPSKRGMLTDLETLTEDDLMSMALDLKPLVERESGLVFEGFPTFRRADHAEFRESLQFESEVVVRRLYDAPENVLDQMIQAQGSGGIVGKYGIKDKVIFLNTRSTAGLVAVSKLPPEKMKDAVCLVLAHEMTHALQDQAADLGRQLENFPDMDAFNGMRGVTEGHASFVEKRVAMAMGLEDIFWQLKEGGQGWGREGLIEPSAYETFALYGQGMYFMDHIYEHRGTKGVWEVIQKPPGTTTMLYRFDQYSPSYPVPSKYIQTLKGIEQWLTKGDWAVINAHLGEYFLRKDTAGLDEDKIGAILAHLEGAHQIHALRRDREAEIRVLDFDNASAPYEYIQLLQAGQEKIAAAKSAASGVPWVVDVTPYEAIQGDAVVRRVVAPKGAHASRTESQSVWVVRGKRLVVVNVSGFRPGLRMDWALEEVYKRMDALSE